VAVSRTALKQAAGRASRSPLIKSLAEARVGHNQTAFLCHSHMDKDLAEGLVVLLGEHGWKLYVDWKDNLLPSTPDKATAISIKAKIESMDWFLFLATPNSMASRWCPWEIGIADGKKANERIMIVPTSSDSGDVSDNEYLQLYSRISDTTTGGWARFPAGASSGVALRELR